MDCSKRALLGLIVLAGTVHGQVTFEIIGDGMATDISADGSVIVGNTMSYEAFWWSAETGIIPLGRPSTFLGMAGSPDVSDDGTKVSAMIGGQSEYKVLWDQSDFDVAGAGFWNAESGSPPTGMTQHAVSDVTAGSGGWMVDRITTYYSALDPTSGTGITQGYLHLFDKYAEPPELPDQIDDDPTASFVVPMTATLDGDHWVITASGLNLHLYSQDYWIGMTPIAPEATWGPELQLASFTVVGDATASYDPFASPGPPAWFNANVGSDAAMLIEGHEIYATPGLWSIETGWQELMPPAPPDGGLIDDSYGSAWGLSGDGTTVVGLYWRPGNFDTGGAHGFAWTEATGVVDLGSNGGNSRANDANYDGSVIVGWDEAPFGFWRSTVWVDGVMTTLSDYEAWCQAAAVTPDGTTIVGSSYIPAEDMHPAAMWRWSGSSWIEMQLGVLPGTAPNQGSVIAFDVTADGNMIVGYNRFSTPWEATGFMWTPGGGMVDVEEFLIDNGIEIDPLFDVQGLNGISDDGTVMVGIGQELVFPYGYKSFIITLPPPESDIPTVSEWGLVGLALLLLSAGTISLRSRAAMVC